MKSQSTSRAAKVIREICNRRRNSDIRADDREVREAFDALLADTERLEFVLAVLQALGVDGLFALVWKPSNAFDRKAIDKARAHSILAADAASTNLPAPAVAMTYYPAFGEMELALLDPPPENVERLGKTTSQYLELSERIVALVNANAWQPIDTAPTDGTVILYAVRGEKPWVTAGRWTEDGWYEINADSSDNWAHGDNPEVWRPMPEVKLP